FNLLTKKISIKYLFNKTMICCITYEKQFQELFPAFATRFFWIRRRLLPPPNPKKASSESWKKLLKLFFVCNATNHCFIKKILNGYFFCQ
ncbi:hypothetical protein, partial [uncultured Chryseobacterium sp.]|uniref:hypothetical protein n=1 Tax=uncultured Chryseobacterium sp. TaxID=259322 RepID=UPI0025883B87